AAASINAGTKELSAFDDGLFPSIHTTMQGTAILEAGRLSLDSDCRPVDILYGGKPIGESMQPTGIELHQFK
ncbi:hypothetical protein TeGR_g8890, partial [Tetraparma gracilis]